MFDMSTCGGCRTCEMACSFHHTGNFVPAASSLKIVEKKDGPGYTVFLREAEDGEGYVCDGCKALDHPLCVDYCREAEDLDRLLKEFEEKNPTGKGTRTA